MAVKKAAGGTKKKDGSSAKKAGGTKGATTKKKAAGPKRSAAGSTKKGGTKGAAKKASPAVRLSASQSDLLQRIGTAGETGYRSGKKAEQRTLDSLQEKRLVKRGAKDKTSGSYSYSISNAGKKHLGSQSGSSGGRGGGGGGGAGGGSASGNF